ncbi:Maf family nucleotide pyrophosphatase [Acinetobacter nectaris]|uniref:Maf family nucleotide pyrophosphatase n=1 Tax=Acinetobacter nectaris TaxID=1219382 RepID=UPI001F0317B5|nr:Maf family nucleotide pyrophosphatase [Acinetobacter nectaris]MCF9046401.1 septum formation inhibitor Maf [Acinetobacter nectaris]
MARLILASGSPRRAELLEQLEIDFDVFSADIDETLKLGECAEIYVKRVAYEKARSVAQQFHDRIVLAADTCISLGGSIVGKPQSRAHAFEIWQALSGREHDVLSGICVIAENEVHECVVKTQVTFQQLSQSDMESYWQTGEPVGKAGAYAIQGIAAKYIPTIKGSYTNVVGLPLHETVKLLKAVKALN